MTTILTSQATCDADGNWTTRPAILTRKPDGNWSDRIAIKPAKAAEKEEAK